MLVWNQLNEDVRLQKSLPTFKRAVKKWIVSRRVPDPGEEDDTS